MELLGAGSESDTILFTTPELLGEAVGTPGGGCADPEDDGAAGPAKPRGAVDDGGLGTEATGAGVAAGEVLPLTAGVPASAPVPAAGGGQLEAGTPKPLAVPLPSADPARPGHESPEPFSGELVTGPLPEGSVLVVGGDVVDEDGGVVVVGSEGAVAAGGVPAGGGVADGEDAAVAAAEAVPSEQSVDPVAVPPAGETLALI